MPRVGGRDDNDDDDEDNNVLHSSLRMEGTASDAGIKPRINDDALEYFESSLESLFGQHQSASGESGQLCTVRVASYDDDAGKRDEDENKGDSDVITYRIPASASNRLFAHYQWDAGVFLARVIHRSTIASLKQQQQQQQQRSSNDALAFRPEADVRGLTVLELGAGTGLPGLISARRGASHVVLSDYPDTGILAAQIENIRLSDVQHCTKACGLDWSDDDAIASLLRTNADGFERVLCADVLWLSSSHAPLLHSIKALMAPTPTARCIVVSGFHTGRRAIAHFFRMACTVSDEPDATSTAPLEKRLLQPSREPDGRSSVFEHNVVTGESRPWSGTIPFASNDKEADGKEDNMDDFTERSKWLSYVVLQWADP